MSTTIGNVDQNLDSQNTCTYNTSDEEKGKTTTIPHKMKLSSAIQLAVGVSVVVLAVLIGLLAFNNVIDKFKNYIFL